MFLKFIHAFLLPYQAGLLILKNRKLLLWSLLPMMVTGLLMLLFFFQFKAFLMSKLIALYPSISLPLWMQSLFGVQDGTFLITTLVWIGQIILLITSAYFFNLIASIVAIPFNDHLAELTEAYTPLRPAPRASLTIKIKQLLIDLLKAFGMFILQLILFVGMIFSNLIPGLILVILVLQSLVMTLTYLSYPQTRRGQGFIKDFQWTLEHLAPSLGFGLSLVILYSTPFLSFFSLPIAIVGGTLLRAQDPR
jgi:uncharacterized protein involved in cysteine biosynthesis